MSTFGSRSRVSTSVSDWMPATDGPPPPTQVEWLLVAGGGYGVGGAGGMKSTVQYTGGSVGTLETVYSVTGGSLYTVSVGAGGGASGTDSRIEKATDASSFLRVKGGSGQGYPTYNGSEAGGSGGGSGSFGYGATAVVVNGMPGTADQGHGGGYAIYWGYGFQVYGAGGGAGGAGSNSSQNNDNGSSYQGPGGPGRTNDIDGTSRTYAQGGGGGSGSRGNNTGDGGNSSQYGNSGIVILRWSTAYRSALSTTGSPTYTIVNNKHIYKFTGSGSITF